MKIEKSEPFFYIVILSLFVTQIFSNLIFVINIFTAFYLLLKRKMNLASFTNINKLIFPLPIYTYVVIILNSFRGKNLLFYDNQLLFTLFNCNRNIDFLYFQRYSFEQIECKSSIGFGLFEKYISTIINPWYASLTIALLFVIYLYLMISKIQDNKKFIFILFFISPPFLFLFTSLNSDLFMFSHLLFIVVNKKNKLSNFDYLLITFFSQLKIYFVGLLFGAALYKYFTKNKSELYKTVYFIILNVSLFIYDIFTNTRSSYQNEIFGVPFVYAPMNTFGIVADLKTFFDVQLSLLENSKFILIVILLFFFVFALFIKNNKNSYKLSSNYEELFMYIFPICMIINFFGNFGYKFVFNFLLVYIIFEVLNFKQNIYIFSVFLVIPIYSALNLVNDHTLFTPSILNSFVWTYSRIVFYVLNLLFIVVFSNILKKIYKNS